MATASSAVLVAGCGSGHHAAPPQRPPRIPAGVAARLGAQAEGVAALAPGTCAARDAAARFQLEVRDSIGRVPARYREQLMSAANDLASRLSACTPPPPPAPVVQGHGEHGDHGKHKGHGKHGHGDGGDGDNG